MEPPQAQAACAHSCSSMAGSRRTMATGILLDSAGDAIQSVRRDICARRGAGCCRSSSPGREVLVAAKAVLSMPTRPPKSTTTTSASGRPPSGWQTSILVSCAAPAALSRGGGCCDRAKSTGAVCSTATQSSTAHGYGPHFAYRERALAADEGVARNLAASRLPPVEKRKKFVARGKLPSPGQGPSVEVRAKSWFRLFFWAERGATGEDGNAGGAAGVDGVLTSVEGGDPGYEETSKMVAEAAIELHE